MRLSVGIAALAGGFWVAPVAGGLGPALAQDFSITNTEAPARGGRRDLVRQLQGWWDVHGYYPRRAAQNDEAGTVGLHLVIRPDGNVFTVDVATGSGSGSLDDAAVAAFRGGFVRPFPEGAPGTEIDISLHYVLAPGRAQAVAAGAVTAGAAPRRPFTITNEPVTSPIMGTMLQKACTGVVVKQGIRNHPAYGTRFSAQAVFFKRPDGTSWVKFDEGGFPVLSPVTEVGKIVKWSGRKEYLGNGTSKFTQYTVWPEGDSVIIGDVLIVYSAEARNGQELNRGGTIDLSCASERVPEVGWSGMSVTPIARPAGDPP